MKQVFAPVFRKASKECFAFLEGSPERLGKAVSSRAFASGPLTLEKLPPGVLNSEYAVRGEVVSLAQKMEAEIKSNPSGHGYPFKKLIPCNIGNPQAVGATPVDYHRQVLSATLDASGSYPADIKKKADEFRTANVGAYTHSKGHPVFRQKIVEYIARRDGLEQAPDIESIFITDGASPGIRTILELVIHDAQYPLYSASVVRGGGTYIGYEFGEDYSAAEPRWTMDFAELENKIADAQSKNMRVRALCVINPGNPTGSLLSKAEIEDCIKLAEKHNLVLLADEVYQENIYTPAQDFVSFYKVAHKMRSKVELVSFHSISKGYYGECGLRGGYMHIHNVDSGVCDQVYKLMSMGLCSNTLGQLMMASVVSPPQPGDASFAAFDAQRTSILDNLKKRAKLVHLKMNHIPGVKCMPVEAAMYAFPEIQLPEKFIAEAKSQQKAPDTYYVIQLLQELGVILVPGSGFGQKEGTYHFRMTILPQDEDLEAFIEGLAKFQKNLYAKYGTPAGVYEVCGNFFYYTKGYSLD